MGNLDEKMSSMAAQVLKRPLTDDERLEMYRICDALGMRDVQSFLHLLLVFKLHEDTMNKKFAAMAALEEKIQNTLEDSVGRVLDEGAERLGEGMKKAVAEGADETLLSLGEYHTLRGQTALVCFICVLSSLAYWLGTKNILRSAPSGGVIETILFLPAGWSIFFCGATYSFLWAGDYWKQIKKTALFKTLFGLQVFLLLILALSLL
jgi:hypothetical protein